MAGVSSTDHDLEARFQRLTIESLEGQHRDILKRALSNVLSTEIAEFTLAQIVDGLPIHDVLYDRYNTHVMVHVYDPMPIRHDRLCYGVLERSRQLYAEFDLKIIKLDSKAVHAYQTASPGSRAFKTRLIELVAVALHQIAVWVYKQNTSLHKGEPPTGHRPPPTYFLHEWYRDYDQYPDGIAGCVGYWVEARILGGVILFDRHSPESHEVYIHPNRAEASYRICRLLDEQKQQLLGFLLHNGPTAPAHCPLPILPTLDNADRVDPEEPIAETGIYRDIWERKEKPATPGDYRLRDVKCHEDWANFEDMRAAASRARGRLYRQSVARMAAEEANESR